MSELVLAAFQIIEFPEELISSGCQEKLIKRVYEVDPLVCPRCHGEMRIVAFIVDAAVIDKILRHLFAKGDHRVRGPPGCADLEAAP
jgi:hypothetical protein